MRYEGAGLTVVFVLTFSVVLPVLCGTWPYSAYYRGGVGSSSSTSADDSSALAYLSQVETTEQQQRPEEGDGRRTFLLVTIVTVRREGQFYLSRVVARLHQLLSKYNNGRGGNDAIRAMICNVDPDPQLHREALDLQRIFPLVQRDHLSVVGGDGMNLMDKEKEDYVFCLNASRSASGEGSPDYILVLEDDAVPLDDLLPVTRRFIDYFDRHRRRRADFFYVKLYHPERLQNYLQPEPWRIAEWLAVSALSVYLLQVVFGFRLRRQSFWLVYFMALVECLGRPHLLQLKRWMLARLVGGDPAAGYNLLEATECCTPAMLFSNASAASASAFLSSITCRKGYAKDTALYLHSRQSAGRLQSFVVEPNLVQHIGRVSTLRRNH